MRGTRGNWADDNEGWVVRAKIDCDVGIDPKNLGFYHESEDGMSLNDRMHGSRI